VSELVAEGRISKEEAEVHPRRNIMTRALGVDPDVSVDLFVEDARAGDRFLLCSDGLPRELRDDHISSLLQRLADPSEAAKELVEEAKRRGGNDNITVIVVDVEDSEKDTAVAPDPPAPHQDAAPVEAPVVAAAPPQQPKARLVTPRVIGFFILLLAILAAAAAGTGWYARSGYFVGLRGDQVTIYQGQPGGVLWFHPTIADATHVTTKDVLSHQLPRLRAGQTEPSLQAARQYVIGLVAEAQTARSAAAAPSTTTTTTQPAPTTVPSSVPPST
jgi:hypothetical protein